MGLREVKACAVQRIREGRIFHVPREYVKNEFAQGAVTAEQVIAMIESCRGDRYETRPHDSDRSVIVHIFRPRGRYDGYYVKCFFLDPDIWFISVHR